MREKPRDPVRLLHIQEACQQLVAHTPEEWKKLVEQYPICFYGIVKLMENIGEATYKLTKEFKAEHPQTNWAPIEKMRHILVHDYYTVDDEMVWEVLKKDIQPLLAQIDSYLGAYDNE